MAGGSLCPGGGLSGRILCELKAVAPDAPAVSLTFAEAEARTILRRAGVSA